MNFCPFYTHDIFASDGLTIYSYIIKETNPWFLKVNKSGVISVREGVYILFYIFH